MHDADGVGCCRWKKWSRCSLPGTSTVCRYTSVLDRKWNFVVLSLFCGQECTHGRKLSVDGISLYPVIFCPGLGKCKVNFYVHQTTAWKGKARFGHAGKLFAIISNVIAVNWICDLARMCNNANDIVMKHTNLISITRKSMEAKLEKPCCTTGLKNWEKPPGAVSWCERVRKPQVWTTTSKLCSPCECFCVPVLSSEANKLTGPCRQKQQRGIQCLQTFSSGTINICECWSTHRHCQLIQISNR